MEALILDLEDNAVILMTMQNVHNHETEVKRLK